MARYGSGNDETIITEYLENTHLEKGIKQKNFDTVLDLIDEYVDLKESVEHFRKSPYIAFSPAVTITFRFL